MKLLVVLLAFLSEHLHQASAAAAQDFRSHQHEQNSLHYASKPAQIIYQMIEQPAPTSPTTQYVHLPFQLPQLSKNAVLIPPHQHQQFLQQALSQTQQQPTMIIIAAQPALLPTNLVYGAAIQQLLSYFQRNPYAKQQLLYGNAQQAVPTTPEPIQNKIVSQQSIPRYLYASPQEYYQPSYVPVHQYAHTYAQTHQQAAVPLEQQLSSYEPVAKQQEQHSAPQQPQQPQQQQQQSSLITPVSTLEYLGHKAQALPLSYGVKNQFVANPVSASNTVDRSAQQYAQNYASSAGFKQAPAIVTGLENFPAEQQAQIRAQLSSYLGTSFHTVKESQLGNLGKLKHSSKYSSNQFSNSKEFKPSPQVDNSLAFKSDKTKTGNH